MVPAERLDFGEAQETRDFTMMIPVRNTSGRTVAITGFDRSCDCVAVEPSSFTIRPGASADITLHIDLTRSRRPQMGATTRPYSSVIQAILDGPHSRGPVWNITGTIKNCFELSQSLIYLGEVTAEDIPLGRHQFLVRNHVPFKRLQARCDPAIALTEVVPPLAGFAPYLIDVNVGRPSRPGPFKVEVAIEAETEGGQICHARGVIEGIADADEIACEPSSLTLGVVPLGRTAEQSVLLTSRRQRPFIVKRVECDDGALRVSAINVSPTSVRYMVALEPTTTGPIRRHVQFHLETDERGTACQELTVSAVGFQGRGQKE